MPRYSEETLRRVAEANDIVETIGSYLPLKRAGSSYKALCPFHNEKTPSFTVSPSRQAFYCFGCGAGGGVIRFVMDYERITFSEAVRKLADRAGIRLIEEDFSRPSEDSRHLRSRLFELHKALAEWFHHLLLKDAAAEPARKALSARGINSAIARNWLLGYAPASPQAILEWLLSKGFKNSEILASGVIGKDEQTGRLYPRFRHRLIIPICDDSGSVAGFSARLLDNDKSAPKYINSPETPIFQKGRLLFGLHKSKRALTTKGEAIVCEGQFDLITAYENGVQNVVAPQGTAFTPEQARLLKRFVRSVVLCFDADTAGEKAVSRSLPALYGENLTVKVVALPQGEDPDSFVRRKGGKAFQERADAAEDAISHLLRLARERGDLAEPAGIAATARSIAALLSCLQDPITREAAAQKAAQLLRITLPRMSKLISEAAAHKQEKDSQQTGLTPTPPYLASPPEACVFLCRQLMESPEALEWLRNQPWEFLRELGGEWKPLLILLDTDTQLDSGRAWASFLATCPEPEQAALAMAASRPPAPDPLDAVKKNWRGLQRMFLVEKIERLKAALQDPKLTTRQLLEGQKELLDLQKKLLDFSEPSSGNSPP